MTAMPWTRRLLLLAAALVVVAVTAAMSAVAAPPAVGVAARSLPAVDRALSPPPTGSGAAMAKVRAAQAVASNPTPDPQLHVTRAGQVWVSPEVWADFLSKAEAALRSTSLADGQIAATMGTLRATPMYGHSGWVYFDSMAAWEALGKVLARAMRSSGGVDGRTGRSGWCAQQAAACQPWWNFSGCTSRTYCCCPPYCDTVFSGFWPLTVAAGRAGGVHACCVESFC
ncbi:hypothetical protein MMPV_003278 [Pyropia vietnamensis]